MKLNKVNLKHRTHMCGELSIQNKGQEAVLMGWVARRRELGGLVFIDLRDRTGFMQVVFDRSQLSSDQVQVLDSLRLEFVVAVQGQLAVREQVNKKIPTGEVELKVCKLELLSSAQTPPISPGDNKVGEDLRLQYRYLDLRNPALQRNLQIRHKALQVTREFLSAEGFLEVETPILYKSTPEGARDYLVPSRVHKGACYALPQSPQSLKQLLMIGGVDKYFQIARCFRDEDLRADRQPEFSQIDVEMSFASEPEIRASAEKLAHALWHKVRGVQLPSFPVLTYRECLEQYGSDKPDLRIKWKLVNLTSHVVGSGFKVFDDVAEQAKKDSSTAVMALAVDSIFSRKRIDELTAKIKALDCKGLVWIKCGEDGVLSSPIKKFVSSALLQKIFEQAGGVKKGCVFVVADKWQLACESLGFLRQHIFETLTAEADKARGDVEKSEFKFLWVKDFPLFEYNEDEGRFQARHHPFTQVCDEDVDDLMAGRRLSQLRAQAYDLVCNGHEIAGGSVRIHRAEVQEAMFRALGMLSEQIKKQFGFFIEALSYGTPPHGGIAWGFDRVVMLLCGVGAIRDVIAFPKTTKASCLMSQSPSSVPQKALKDLGLILV